MADTFWMIGVIGVMAVFAVCALVGYFKNREAIEEEDRQNKIKDLGGDP